MGSLNWTTDVWAHDLDHGVKLGKQTALYSSIPSVRLKALRFFRNSNHDPSVLQTVNSVGTTSRNLVARRGPWKAWKCSGGTVIALTGLGVQNAKVHLSVLQGHNAGVLGGADDVVVIVDAFDGPLAKPLDAISFGSCQEKDKNRGMKNNVIYLTKYPCLVPYTPYLACTHMQGREEVWSFMGNYMEISHTHGGWRGCSAFAQAKILLYWHTEP